MLGVAQFRRRAGQHRTRVLEVGRGVGRAAVLAVVAVLVRRAAVRAGALDVAVRQEHLPDRVVKLADRARRDVATRAQARVHVLGQFAVLRRVRGVVPVVRDAEAGEIPLVAFLHGADEVLGRYPGLLRREHDRRAMRVIGRHEVHRIAGHAPRAHPDVALDVAQQVADVQRAVRIGQGMGDEEGLVRRTHASRCPLRCCKAELLHEGRGRSGEGRGVRGEG